MSNYGVKIWASHPDNNNDDCITGGEVPTAEEANALLTELCAKPWAASWQFAEIIGPSGQRVYETFNPETSPPETEDLADNEFAMQQGMAFGVDAYNEARGFGR
jgi:hypothetical protein